MRKRVSPYSVVHLFTPWVFLPEDMPYPDFEDEDKTRDLIKRTVLPEFLSFDEHSQSMVKDSLRYYLGNGQQIWPGLVDNNQSWIASPKDEFGLIMQVWAVLFPGEPVGDIERDEYQVDMDIHSGNSVSKRTPQQK